MVEVQVSIPLAFLAGVVSVLSACVLPLLPGYLAFVTALSVDELAGGSVERARGAAAAHSFFFLTGFGLVFLSLGLVATPLGALISRSLPWIQRAGGVLLALWGVYLAAGFAAKGDGVAPPAAGARAARATGSLFTGLAFGAGWTPCIGPVLGSILLYVSQDGTMVEGGVLLLSYAIGLGLPFFLLSMGLNWPLAGSTGVMARVGLLRRIAGGVIAAIGVALLTGYFARLTAFLAGLGQLINLEL
ncbi:MAG: cytochrome c biogenesis protein CcdA [Gemmatimonadota bacterium]